MDDTPAANVDQVTVTNRETVATTPERSVALDCVTAGIDAARPDHLVDQYCDFDNSSLSISTLDGTSHEYDVDAHDRVLVLGGGKAAGVFARALWSLLGDRIDDGIVVTTTDGAAGPIDLVAGRHPVPDETALTATRQLLDFATDADESTLVFVVLTGGGSALLPAPADGLSLETLQATTDALLSSGAPIDAINAVRKHCSQSKGGQLGAACAPATTVTLALSDVVGDDPATIASGPTVPDPTSYDDALAAIEQYDVAVPEAVMDHLRAGTDGRTAETPTEAAPSSAAFHLLGTNRTAIEAAAATAAAAGYEPLVLSTAIEGDARSAGAFHAAVSKEIVTSGDPVDPPAVVLSGGETTVTLQGEGRGGPNTETALSAALEIEHDRVTFASVDTDGIDGQSGAAGGIVGAQTVEDTVEATAALDRNDSATYLDQQSGLIETGATGTNVNDLRVLVVGTES